jgi:hypothetical protein
MPTIKILELIGVSQQSWEDAVAGALAEANKTVRNITGADVIRMTAKVVDGKIAEYHADVKFAFRIEER